MENHPRSVHNQMTVGGSMTGPVIQSGGSVNVTGGIRVRAAADPLATLADRVDQVRDVLRAHADQVPRRAMTDLGLSQIATQARNPSPDTPGIVGELWRDLLPGLTELSDTIGGLSALKPQLTAITKDIDAL
ncbi:hypothetical protein [Actinokineospora sp. NPDC004072]